MHIGGLASMSQCVKFRDCNFSDFFAWVWNYYVSEIWVLWYTPPPLGWGRVDP